MAPWFHRWRGKIDVNSRRAVEVYLRELADFRTIAAGSAWLVAAGLNARPGATTAAGAFVKASGAGNCFTGGVTFFQPLNPILCAFNVRLLNVNGYLDPLP